MTVYKRPNRKNLFATLRNWAQDPRLPNNAVGLLARMLSMPEDWDFYQKELNARCDQDGLNGIRSQMKDLVRYGYLIKYPRARNENGSFGNVQYEVWDFAQIDEPLSEESVEKIFSAKYNINDFNEIYQQNEKIQIILPKSDLHKQAADNYAKRNLQYNKEQLTTLKEDNNSNSIVILSKCEMMKEIKISEKDKHNIAKEYENYSDEDFKTYVEAAIDYIEKNPDLPAIAIVKKSLRDKWKPNKKKKLGEEQVKENLALSKSIFGDMMEKIGKLGLVTANVCNNYIEFSCGPKTDIFEYTDPCFSETVNKYLKHIGSKLKLVALEI